MQKSGEAKAPPPPSPSLCAVPELYQLYSSLFPSTKAALLLLSAKNRDLWAGPTPGVLCTRTSRQIWLAENTNWILCACSVNRARTGHDPILVLGKSTAASGNENARALLCRFFFNVSHGLFKQHYLFSHKLIILILYKTLKIWKHLSEGSFVTFNLCRYLWRRTNAQNVNIRISHKRGERVNTMQNWPFRLICMSSRC